jgi:pimeloyl-ACP methyl ester carboxylesterase
MERGQGESVLLVHGFNLDSATWVKNVDPLAEHFHVFAPDLWGEGFSTRQPLDYGYPLYKEQILIFMDALGIESASLVGHSMGGGISTVFTLEHPERVEKLVLVDSTGIPASLPFRAKIFRLRGVAELLLSLPTDMTRRRNLEDFWIYNKDLLTDNDYEDFTRFQKIEGTTEALLAILRKNFFNTLHEELQALGKLDVPVHIVWGREDKSLPLRSGQEMHRLIEGSKLAIVDDAGHMPNFERADVFNKLVMEFLLGDAS